MAAILKIVISISLHRIVTIWQNLVCKRKFWLNQRKCEKISEIPKFKMADRRHIENHFLAITRLHIVRLRRNLKFVGIIACAGRLDDENAKFQKSNMADRRHIENHYISISQPRIVRIWRNLVSRRRFWPRPLKCENISDIPKFKMADGRHIENHFWL